jgi:hypothetical protein
MFFNHLKIFVTFVTLEVVTQKKLGISLAITEAFFFLL